MSESNALSKQNTKVEDSMMPPPPNRSSNTTTTLQDDGRLMNDTTMPPPPNRATNDTTNNPRRRHKTGVRPRFGLHDWKRLLAASNDLAQRKGAPLRRDISLQEVRQHRLLHDGWIVLRGKVYNLGPYLPYHPGGVEILKGVLGKDATALFDKYHRWVNIDGLIGPLLLGTVSASPAPPNPFSVVPPKESHLGNAPRIAVATTSSSLLLDQGNGDDEEEEDDDDELLPQSTS